MNTGKVIENNFINKNKRLVYIRKGLTSILHPLDISIKKFLKKEFRKNILNIL